MPNLGLGIHIFHKDFYLTLVVYEVMSSWCACVLNTYTAYSSLNDSPRLAPSTQNISNKIITYILNVREIWGSWELSQYSDEDAICRVSTDYNGAFIILTLPLVHSSATTTTPLLVTLPLVHSSATTTTPLLVTLPLVHSSATTTTPLLVTLPLVHSSATTTTPLHLAILLVRNKEARPNSMASLLQR
jgi:hypothetical protein